ncbi:MAG: radical SAM/SPASM domain-containing protein [Deltaproteobacteria bacterium]
MFSSSVHRECARKGIPTDCHFELTYGCPLRCRHCYSSCYDRPSLLRKELKTKEVLRVLDKLREAGIVWLCFTGGDPLSRGDFAVIYEYARRQGFVISLFTSGFRCDRRALRALNEFPPFSVEMTLNAATSRTFRIITGRDGLEDVVRTICSFRRCGFPVTVKTLVSRLNFGELGAIRELLGDLGLPFRPGALIFPRLNGDHAPCRLRLSSSQFSKLIKGSGMDAGCRTKGDAGKALFSCAAGNGNCYIDPYGYMRMCLTFREGRKSLLDHDVEDIFSDFACMRKRERNADSVCLRCPHRGQCVLCPGKALLESGDPAGRPAFYCDLARVLHGSKEPDRCAS